MTSREKLLRAIETYCERTGYSYSYASLKCAGSGEYYKELQRGAGITMEKYERVIKWLRKHTPKGEKK